MSFLVDLVGKSGVIGHRCPFWLIWWKVVWAIPGWWFNQLPGPAIFNQKGYLCEGWGREFFFVEPTRELFV